MKTFRATMILPLFGILASLAACSGQAPIDGTGSTSSSITVPSQGEQLNIEHKARHGMRMGRGPASLLFASLREPINLTAEQRTTIEAAIATLKPQGQKPAGNDARKSALVAAIRANNVNVDKLGETVKPAIDHSAREATLAKALTALHDTLTPEQRSLLVTAVEKRMTEGCKRSAHNKGDHAGKTHKGQKGEKGSHKKLGGKHAGGFGSMRMLKGLDLTQEQTDAIQAKLAANKPAPKTEAEREAMKAQHAAMKKEMTTRLETFSGDNFDAKAFVARPANMPKMEGKGGGRMMKDLAVVVPLLTPEQREKLATKIEQGPAAHKAPKAQ